MTTPFDLGLHDGEDFGETELDAIEAIINALKDITNADHLAALNLRYVAVPTAWTGVTFSNSWVDYDAGHPCQYRREGDRVFLRGLMKSGTLNVATFTLPAGFRPIQGDETFVVQSNGPGYVGLITISSAGVAIPLTPTVNTACYLDGINFSTVA